MAKPPHRAAKPGKNNDGETGSRFPPTHLTTTIERRQELGHPTPENDGARHRGGPRVAKPPHRAAKPRKNNDGETGSRLPRTCLAIAIVRRQGLEPRTR
ncbi:hypothetical protein [Streptomyces olivaceus]|uniref:hypothetical protein n=1 Tax=Streptomyces olivaceus TaxID=47716 RepID=UPI0018849403|nr:hypothetical protein [Streptomyces olivaceus]